MAAAPLRGIIHSRISHPKIMDEGEVEDADLDERGLEEGETKGPDERSNVQRLLCIPQKYMGMQTIAWPAPLQGLDSRPSPTTV